jgi:hypothetical protein
MSSALGRLAATRILIDKYRSSLRKESCRSNACGQCDRMKLRNFHENYVVGEIKPPSERATGVMFGALAVIVAVLWRNSPVVPWIALVLAVGITVVSLLAPTLLKPLNIFWFRFGLLLHRIVNPVVMFAMFALVFVPAGMLMRRADPLRLRRTMAASSYWIEPKKSDNSARSMLNQF